MSTRERKMWFGPKMGGAGAVLVVFGSSETDSPVVRQVVLIVVLHVFLRLVRHVALLVVRQVVLLESRDVLLLV